jgi:hypothetical protein
MAALVAELVAIDTENPPGRLLGRCGRLLCANRNPQPCLVEDGDDDGVDPNLAPNLLLRLTKERD